MRKPVVLGILLFLAPLFTFAHGTNYLEFNPDKSVPLRVADVATPYQVFFAQNDFLGGFDVWIANPSSAGTATFALLNEQGSVLTSKTAFISNIAQTQDGTKLHVDFNSQVAVLAGEKYSIRVTSSMPELRLYYSERVQVLSHNAPFVSPYTTGVAKLGSEEQTFSFEYALYETTESSAPIISNIGWTAVSSTEMRADFNANEPIDYKIDYGLSGQGYTQSTNFTGGYQFCADGVGLCSISISVLPNMAYQYTLTVKDSWGNQSQSNGTFISGEGQTPPPTSEPTPAVSPSVSPMLSPTPIETVSPSSPPGPTSTPDLSPLVISNVRIVSVTDKSAQIAWTTNKAANSYLLISTTFLITVTNDSDPTMEVEHFLTVPNVLSPSTTYVAKVTSIDAVNNETSVSIDFTTLPPAIPDVSPAPQSNPSNSITTSYSGSDGSVSWNPLSGGKASDGYRVDIFDRNGNLIRTINVPAGSDSAGISGLSEGEYSVIVYSNDKGVFKKVNQPVRLKVGPSAAKKLLSFWWALIPLLAGLGYILWRNYKNRFAQAN